MKEEMREYRLVLIGNNDCTLHADQYGVITSAEAELADAEAMDAMGDRLKRAANSKRLEHQAKQAQKPTTFKKYSWGWYNDIREMSYDSKYLHG